MTACALPLSLPLNETRMGKPTKNDPVLYRWALGWILTQLRTEETDLTLEAFGEILEISGPGYKNFEAGKSTNLDRWHQAFDVVDKDIVAVYAMARTIVRAIQAEEMFEGERISIEARTRIAESAYMGKAANA